MRRNMEQVILDLNNEPVMDPLTKKALTLTTASLNALLATYDDERGLTGKEKADRMQLALKINKRPSEVDLTAEQMTKLKELIGKAYGPLVVGRAYEMLEMEPRAVEKDAGTAG